MIKVYTSHGCGSGRKAIKYFKTHNIAYSAINVMQTKLSKDEILWLLTRCDNGAVDIISTRSKIYKHLGGVDDLKLSELVTLIQEHPSILSRPIIVSKNKMLIGYDDEEITMFRYDE